MRFTAVVNLVIFLALAVGAAGLPGLPGQSPDPMFTGPSLFFSLFLSAAFNIFVTRLVDRTRFSGHH
jgi:hypothetical protein